MIKSGSKYLYVDIKHKRYAFDKKSRLARDYKGRIIARFFYSEEDYKENVYLNSLLVAIEARIGTWINMDLKTAKQLYKALYKTDKAVNTDFVSATEIISNILNAPFQSEYDRDLARRCVKLSFEEKANKAA